MFYDNFLRICETNGVSPTRVLTQLGISKGSLSRWKEGGEPRNEMKKAIADFLGVSVEELKNGKTKKPTEEIRELSDLDRITIEAFKQLTDENRALVAALVAGLKQKS